MKINNLWLEDDINTKVGPYIDDKINVKNVTTFYQLAKHYKLKSLAKTSMSYIERCFAMIVDSPSFLELEYNRVLNILTNSELRA